MLISMFTIYLLVISTFSSLFQLGMHAPALVIRSAIGTQPDTFDPVDESHTRELRSVSDGHHAPQYNHNGKRLQRHRNGHGSEQENIKYRSAPPAYRGGAKRRPHGAHHGHHEKHHVTNSKNHRPVARHTSSTSHATHGNHDSSDATVKRHYKTTHSDGHKVKRSIPDSGTLVRLTDQPPRDYDIEGDKSPSLSEENYPGRLVSSENHIGLQDEEIRLLDSDEGYALSLAARKKDLDKYPSQLKERNDGIVTDSDDSEGQIKSPVFGEVEDNTDNGFPENQEAYGQRDQEEERREDVRDSDSQIDESQRDLDSVESEELAADLPQETDAGFRESAFHKVTKREAIDDQNEDQDPDEEGDQREEEEQNSDENEDENEDENDEKDDDHEEEEDEEDDHDQDEEKSHDQDEEGDNNQDEEERHDEDEEDGHDEDKEDDHDQDEEDDHDQNEEDDHDQDEEDDHDEDEEESQDQDEEGDHDQDEDEDHDQDEEENHDQDEEDDHDQDEDDDHDQDEEDNHEKDEEDANDQNEEDDNNQDKEEDHDQDEEENHDQDEEDDHDQDEEDGHDQNEEDDHDQDEEDLEEEPNDDENADIYDRLRRSNEEEDTAKEDDLSEELTGSEEDIEKDDEPVVQPLEFDDNFDESKIPKAKWDEDDEEVDESEYGRNEFASDEPSTHSVEKRSLTSDLEMEEFPRFDPEQEFDEMVEVTKKKEVLVEEILNKWKSEKLDPVYPRFHELEANARWILSKEIISSSLDSAKEQIGNMVKNDFISLSRVVVQAEIALDVIREEIKKYVVENDLTEEELNKSVFENPSIDLLGFLKENRKIKETNATNFINESERVRSNSPNSHPDVDNLKTTTTTARLETSTIPVENATHLPDTDSSPSPTATAPARNSNQSAPKPLDEDLTTAASNNASSDAKAAPRPIDAVSDLIPKLSSPSIDSTSQISKEESSKAAPRPIDAFSDLIPKQHSPSIDSTSQISKEESSKAAPRPIDAVSDLIPKQHSPSSDSTPQNSKEEADVTNEAGKDIENEADQDSVTTDRTTEHSTLPLSLVATTSIPMISTPTTGSQETSAAEGAAESGRLETASVSTGLPTMTSEELEPTPSMKHSDNASATETGEGNVDFAKIDEKDNEKNPASVENGVKSKHLPEEDFRTETSAKKEVAENDRNNLNDLHQKERHEKDFAQSAPKPPSDEDLTTAASNDTSSEAKTSPMPIDSVSDLIPKQPSPSSDITPQNPKEEADITNEAGKDIENEADQDSVTTDLPTRSLKLGNPKNEHSTLPLSLVATTSIPMISTPTTGSQETSAAEGAAESGRLETPSVSTGLPTMTSEELEPKPSMKHSGQASATETGEGNVDFAKIDEKVNKTNPASFENGVKSKHMPEEDYRTETSAKKEVAENDRNNLNDLHQKERHEKNFAQSAPKPLDQDLTTAASNDTSSEAKTSPMPIDSVSDLIPKLPSSSIDGTPQISKEEADVANEAGKDIENEADQDSATTDRTTEHSTLPLSLVATTSIPMISTPTTGSQETSATEVAAESGRLETASVSTGLPTMTSEELEPKPSMKHSGQASAAETGEGNVDFAKFNEKDNEKNPASVENGVKSKHLPEEDLRTETSAKKEVAENDKNNLNDLHQKERHEKAKNRAMQRAKMIGEKWVAKILTKGRKAAQKPELFGAQTSGIAQGSPNITDFKIIVNEKDIEHVIRIPEIDREKKKKMEKLSR